MVKVVYQPPPFGPRTNLASGAYGPGVKTPWVVRLSKMPAGPVMVGAVASAMVVCSLPQLCKLVNPVWHPKVIFVLVGILRGST